MDIYQDFSEKSNQAKIKGKNECEKLLQKA